MEHSDFSQFLAKFFQVWASFNPSNAFRDGWREYGGQIPNHSLARIQTYRHFLLMTRKTLEGFDYDQLNEVNKLDYLVLQTFISSTLFSIDDLQVYTSNPLVYTDPAFIFEYLLKKYAPLEQRVKEMILHLLQLPEYYATALKNLEIEKVAAEHVEIATKMLNGMISFLDRLDKEVQGLATEYDPVSEAVVAEVREAKEVAKNALQQYIDELLRNQEGAKGDYRLGKDRFTKMLLCNEAVDYPLEKILAAGTENLEYCLAEVQKAAQKVDPGKSVEEIAREIREDHPSAENLLPEVANMLVTLKKFLLDTDFVSVPSEVMPEVIVTPKPHREFYFAAMDTPGPLEEKATDSYYYITPPEPEWSEKEQQEWLETFNYPGLLDISAHEAFPGHYLHHLHNQRSRYLASKVFDTYHFVEGWALYIEEAMWIHGFQAGDYRYRIAQLFETLLRDVRLIVAIKLHADPSFSLEQATELFMKHAFLGKKPAESEAFRATHDPGYLNYALGKLMVEKLRRDYEEEKGAGFNLKTFHDELLSYGAPPIPILRNFMLKNGAKHGEIL